MRTLRFAPTLIHARNVLRVTQLSVLGMPPPCSTRCALAFVSETRAGILQSRAFGTIAAVVPALPLRQRGPPSLLLARSRRPLSTLPAQLRPVALRPDHRRSVYLLSGPKPRQPAADPPSEVGEGPMAFALGIPGAR